MSTREPESRTRTRRRLGSLIVEARPGFASGERSEDGVIQLRMNNVSKEGALDLRGAPRVPADARRVRQYCLEPGDVLFNCTNSQELVGKTALFLGHSEPVVYSNHFLRLRTKPDQLYPGFLKYWLIDKWKKRLFEARSVRWVNQATMRLDTLAGLEIDLPSITEQSRISTTLDTADQIRRKRRRASTEVDALKRAIFLCMFGSVKENAKQFSKEHLGELIRVRSGDFLPAREMDASGTHSVYGGNGITGRHSSYMFEESKIVIGRVGVYCGAIHVTEPKSWVTDNALYVSEFSPHLVFDYLTWALRVANLNKRASQAAQPLISAGRINSVEIIVPPMKLQLLFKERISKLRDIGARLNCLVSESDALFASLAQRAFGKL